RHERRRRLHRDSRHGRGARAAAQRARPAARSRAQRHSRAARAAGRGARTVIRKRRWVLASSNRGKAAELAALLAQAGVAIELVTQAELGIASAPEEAPTFVENALAKARHA